MDFITVKDNRIVAKIKNDKGDFRKSVIIPTDMYPLCNDDFKIFHCDNTEQLNDKKALDIIDTVKYKIAHCYQNTENLIYQLSKNGYSVKSYVGWLFVFENQFPIHHCWCVLEDKYVIDLSDDFTNLITSGVLEKSKCSKNIYEARKVIVEYTKLKSNMKNSERCFPIGYVTPSLFYIGAECKPDDGRKIYRDLISKFPDHECQRDIDGSGLNETQKMIKEQGLL